MRIEYAFRYWQFIGSTIRFINVCTPYYRPTDFYPSEVDGLFTFIFTAITEAEAEAFAYLYCSLGLKARLYVLSFPFYSLNGGRGLASTQNDINHPTKSKGFRYCTLGFDPT